MLVIPFAGHHQAEFRGIGTLGSDRKGKPAVDNGLNAIGERHHFFEVLRDQEHRGSRAPRFEQARMDRDDSSFVEPARRLRCNEDARPVDQIAPEDEFLHVAAREQARPRRRPAAAHVEGIDDLSGKCLGCLPIDEAMA